MRIVVTGGTGFIGRSLCRRLREEGHEVTVLARDPHSAGSRLDRRITVIGWEGSGSLPKAALSALGESDAIVNLTGAPVAAKRWTAKVKHRLQASREGATSALVEALTTLRRRPAHLLNASAIGYYGPRQDEFLTEDSLSGAGFLAGLCRAWEDAARAAEALGICVTLLRIGVVLGRGGGALSNMLPPFRVGLGGPMGKGSQWMSWIHLDDLVGLVLLLLTQPVAGPVNATAPHPVTNREFARILGQVLRRPAFMPAPAFALRLLLGEMAQELLLTGQRVLPRRAQQLGFRFHFPELGEALRAALR